MILRLSISHFLKIIFAGLSHSRNPMCYHAVQCSFLNLRGGEVQLFNLEESKVVTERLLQTTPNIDMNITCKLYIFFFLF